MVIEYTRRALVQYSSNQVPRLQLQMPQLPVLHGTYNYANAPPQYNMYVSNANGSFNDLSSPVMQRAASGAYSSPVTLLGHAPSFGSSSLAQGMSHSASVGAPKPQPSNMIVVNQHVQKKEQTYPSVSSPSSPSTSHFESDMEDFFKAMEDVPQGFLAAVDQIPPSPTASEVRAVCKEINEQKLQAVHHYESVIVLYYKNK